MFDQFTAATQDVDGSPVHYVRGGSGPALLLLHGHPQTHVIWHKVAGALARHFTVIAADLRGYGDSGKPQGLPGHANYSKRAMGGEQVRLMASLGFDRFSLMGHDRGGRVAYRMALDFPRQIQRLVVLDIAPTLAMYEQTTREFATSYFHWFFLIRPAPFPELLINGNPDAYLEHSIGPRPTDSLGTFTPEAWDQYRRCLRDPATIHGICEDYRASAGIDLDHERADLAAGRRIACDMLVLWSEQGVIARCFDPLAEWRKLADRVQGCALPCNHYIPEEHPDGLLAEALPFLLQA